jgi:hypothetical protein
MIPEVSSEGIIRKRRRRRNEININANKDMLIVKGAFGIFVYSTRVSVSLVTTA